MNEHIDDVTRTLPHALGPEKSVLSSILQEPAEFLARAADLALQPDHFYLPQHRTLYETILTLSAANAEIELISLIQHLLDHGLLDRCGGPASVTDLYTYAPSPGHFDHHVSHVIGKHVLRRIIQVSNESIANAYDQPGEPWTALDEAERQILRIRDEARPRATETNATAISGILDDMQLMLQGKTDQIGMPTGFFDLDRMTGGLRPGQMFVIAARPSMGKSALMMNIVEHCVFPLDQPAQVFSLEMSRKELLARLMFSRAKFNPAMLNGQPATQGDLMRVKSSAIAIQQAPLHIDDTPAITITELRAKARRAKSRHGVKLIAIDYLQLVKSTSKQAQNSREREIGEISAGIKAMAKELHLPVIVLAQLNRDSEKRTGKNKGVPRMSDLRESGAIEQDADLVGLLHRASYFAEDEQAKEEIGNYSRLILAKNRNGQTGDQHLSFIPELVRFENGTQPKPAHDEPRRGRPDF
jgi:replicative DNA helicase